ARTAFLTAAVRARSARSADGLLRAVEGFVTLGDDQVAERCLREAETFAADESTTRARVRAAAERLRERSATAEASP
ncbi:MAG: hypothetical protein ACREJ9_13890, partial [Candidatus Rokuibacteriota bacterium]